MKRFLWCYHQQDLLIQQNTVWTPPTGNVGNTICSTLFSVRTKTECFCLRRSFVDTCRVRL